MKIQAFQADVLYLGNGQEIREGIVEFDPEGRVINLGKHPSDPNIPIKKLAGALCPGFVNSHCHLELSHLKGKVSQGTKLTGFIKELQSIRNAGEKEILEAAENADSEMKKAGIVAVADICNDSLCFSIKSESKIKYHNLVELFGFNPEKAKQVFEKGKKLMSLANKQGMEASLVPHSPYSVSARLMKLIAEFDSSALISIHNQETKSENDLFQSAEGDMAELLRSFGNSMNHFEAIGKNSIYSFLPAFSSNRKILLVHNTFSTKEDLFQAEKSHSNLFWCFCPSANRYIEKSLPQFQNFVEARVNCCLGTDSLASNEGLSILDEMKIIQENSPSISTKELMQWACLNGAKFLNLESSFGSLEPGKKPGLNWIKNIENKDSLGPNSEIEVLV